MSFNSLTFACFLPLVFLLYWFVFQRNLLRQNLFIVVASYLFYGWWDWRFLLLIAFTSFCSWGAGLLTLQNRRFLTPKLLTVGNVVLNLLLLCAFKYFNFFIDSFISMFAMVGIHLHPVTLKLILPVGISFYTFQALSYTIDVYRKRIEPTRDIVAFFAFISFFPQLVAGPIERATNLLPQFERRRTFDYAAAVDGLRQILWGLFKKVFVADHCAASVNYIFDNSEHLSGSTLWWGAVFFSMQLYGDFSGYSDIAIGVARLFGIRLRRNFAFPFFSRDIAEFWRRWHISLTTWFRDYVYIPMGGSRVSKLRIVLNTFVIFILSGLWHGANLTFIVWGTFHAILFLPLILLGRNRKYLTVVAENRVLPTLRELLQILLTYWLVTFGFIFFRANDVHQAFAIIRKVFSQSFFDVPDLGPDYPVKLAAIYTCLLVEWLGRHHEHALECLGQKWPRILRYAMYYAIIIIIIMFPGEEQQFIYFQF
ncbi:MAG: MBOAT family protein [Bacteroidales bacterium]|jgi:D-alanyl-lipoteichoic acid acyltransferase DltB (MBOAT superfamily)|nr:MBOAT family protein [Bacteroidales bacterium]